MMHPRQEELVLFLSGDADGQATVASHLEVCAQCRDELQQLRRLVALAADQSVPDPGDDFEERIWRYQSRHLQLRPIAGAGGAAAGGSRWLALRWAGGLGALAASLLLAFLLGRGTSPAPLQPPPLASETGPSSTDTAPGERVLLAAVGEQLRRSRLLLAELAHTPAGDVATVAWQQQRAAELVRDSRLVRQSARLRGRTELAGLLEQVERLLLDVARAPSGGEESQAWRQRIEDNDLLFKVSAAEFARTSRRGPSA